MTAATTAAASRTSAMCIPPHDYRVSPFEHVGRTRHALAEMGVVRSPQRRGHDAHDRRALLLIPAGHQLRIRLGPTIRPRRLLYRRVGSQDLALGRRQESDLARHVDDRVESEPVGGAEHGVGAADVHGAHLIRPACIHGKHRRGVQDGIGALERALDGDRVRHVAGHDLDRVDAKGRERGRNPLGRSCQDPDPVPGPRERRDRV
jgi:hypothetical protein